MKIKYKQKFLFGLEVVLENKLPQPPYHGKNWSVNFKDLRGYEEGIGTNYGLSHFKNGKTVKSKHCVIFTNSEKVAEEVATLIHTCLCIIKGNKFFVPELSDFFPLAKISSGSKISLSKNPSSSLQLPPPVLSCSGIQEACYMAAKISFDSSLIFAAHRLSSSYEFTSVPQIELDPHHSENIEVPTLNRKFNPIVQVYMANTILLSYGAIEELGLNPAAKDLINGNKTTRDRNTGEWGEASKAYMLEKLKKRKIDPEKSFLWMAREKERFLEKKRKTKPLKKMPWAKGYRNRDQEVTLLDAIADASFLRSKIAAHTFSSTETIKLFKTLSVYEALNVQNLARVLLLESVGVIKYWHK